MNAGQIPPQQLMGAIHAFHALDCWMTAISLGQIPIDFAQEYFGKLVGDEAGQFIPRVALEKVLKLSHRCSGYICTIPDSKRLKLRISFFDEVPDCLSFCILRLEFDESGIPRGGGIDEWHPDRMKAKED